MIRLVISPMQTHTGHLHHVPVSWTTAIPMATSTSCLHFKELLSTRYHFGCSGDVTLLYFIHKTVLLHANILWHDESTLQRRSRLCCALVGQPNPCARASSHHGVASHSPLQHLVPQRPGIVLFYNHCLCPACQPCCWYCIHKFWPW
jgi:hypothetical protein